MLRPASPPETSRRPYTRIDWNTAVELLADGHTAARAAAAIGLDENRLWRHWQRSRRFRNHVQILIERRRGLLGLQLGPAAATAALARCRALEGLAGGDTEMDAAMLTLLAGGDLRTDAPAASTRERVESIGRAGVPRRPPGQPKSQAPATEPAVAEAGAPPAAEAPPRVVTVRRLTMHRVTTPPQLPPAPISTAAPTLGGMARDEAVPNGPERAAAVQNGTKRAESGRNEPQRSAPALSDGESPPPFRARPDFITDLPSPDFPDGIPYARSSPEGGSPG